MCKSTKKESKNIENQARYLLPTLFKLSDLNARKNYTSWAKHLWMGSFSPDFFCL
jgi:hypothetical protein